MFVKAYKLENNFESANTGQLPLLDYDTMFEINTEIFLDFPRIYQL